MSITFDDPMNPEAKKMLEQMFHIEAMDEKTALLGKMERAFTRNKLGRLANTARQPVSLEINEIGDRKEVGGVVYELDEKGWRRLPIGTKL